MTTSRLLVTIQGLSGDLALVWPTLPMAKVLVIARMDGAREGSYHY